MRVSWQGRLPQVSQSVTVPDGTLLLRSVLAVCDTSHTLSYVPQCEQDVPYSKLRTAM